VSKGDAVTPDEAKSQLLALLPLTDTQLAAAVALPPEELADLIRGFQLASQPEDVPFLKKALDFAKAHESDFSFLGPIGLALQGIIDFTEVIA
jgi:hypothetical protein